MTIRGGDIRQFTIGGREFEVASEAAFELAPSGFENTFLATGNGSMVGTQKRILGMIDSIEVSIDNERADLEYLAGIRDDGEPVPVTLTLAGDATYSGSMGIEAELRYKTDTGTATFSMRGPKLEQI